MWHDAVKVILGREVAGFLVRLAYALLGALAGGALPPAH